VLIPLVYNNCICS